MKLPAINGWTAIVCVAGIAGVCLLVYLKAEPETLGAYSAFMIGLASALEKLFPGEPPAPPVGPSALGVLCLAMTLSGCAAFQNAAPSLLPTAKQVECVVSEVEKGEHDPLTVSLACGFEANAIDFVAHLIEGAQTAKAKRPMLAGCGTDAGAK